ncbi:hypothetical protein PR202_ga12749 [Eleusine coracana subsp. coracana]|uniref:Bifunctional inhibitor/plant lipid transfer protein/seed storage helical domain-containing protein n=1 Tax=Eleusine coracana subsp. coracana TaxID=191504 RepID=A0AAV5CCY6_ELECO|nr:hypothetical protein PR202_ga12749 [Eleusine coracana subsp. coracana]
MASFKLVALFFFAFAVAAAIVQPSEARPQAVLKPDCADQHGQAPHPSPVTSAPSPVVSPVISTPSPPAQPTECLTPLLGMMSCMDYLTNLTVLTPPSTCCDGLKSVINDAPICLCHGMNGDMNSLMPKPIDPVRMMILPVTCGTTLPLQIIFSCNSKSLVFVTYMYLNYYF